MSANVELIRALQPAPDVDLTEFFHRGHDDGAAAQAEALAPVFTDDFVCIFHAISEDPRPGVEGLRDSWLDWLAPWQAYRAEIEDVIEVGDHVLVLSRDF